MPKGIYIRTKAIKEILSLAHKGKKSNNALELWRLNGGKIKGREKGCKAWNKGLKLPQFSGVYSPHWIKDRTKLAKRQERNDMAYKDWRRNVWLRDDFKCRIANQDCKGRLETHHILGWTAFPELRYEVKNGITLCNFHHPRKKADERNLVSVFQKLVES